MHLFIQVNTIIGERKHSFGFREIQIPFFVDECLYRIHARIASRRLEVSFLPELFSIQSSVIPTAG